MTPPRNRTEPGSQEINRTEHRRNKNRVCFSPSRGDDVPRHEGLWKPLNPEKTNANAVGKVRCRYFINPTKYSGSTCKRGDKCKYLHEVDQRQGPSQSQSMLSDATDQGQGMQQSGQVAMPKATGERGELGQVDCNKELKTSDVSECQPVGKKQKVRPVRWGPDSNNPWTNPETTSIVVPKDRVVFWCNLEGHAGSQVRGLPV